MYNNFLGKIATGIVCTVGILSFATDASASVNSVIPPIKLTKKISASGQLRKVLATAIQKKQFTFIAKKLNELKLPQELALIPMIESHYNKKAVSPKGAGGLWQLMPATAKQFGIASKDRFRLEPSTVAALTYFSKLHRKFGKWEFAIAAYNAGDGRVQKALSKNPTATSVEQLTLPKETKQYVQRFYQIQDECSSSSA